MHAKKSINRHQTSNYMLLKDVNLLELNRNLVYTPFYDTRERKFPSRPGPKIYLLSLSL